MMLLADLPTLAEFDICARDLISRLYDADDLNEPDMADYLMTNIFFEEDGFIDALWRSGFASVPAGFTTYLSNALESRCWRFDGEPSKACYHTILHTQMCQC